MASETVPVLPAEIMDVIIDHLGCDLEMLGVCGMVCSEWLIRSRHYIFSTVQLWPWRVRRFFDLARSQKCTFTKYVNRIEMDDSQAKGQNQCSTDEDEILFSRVISSSSLSRFSHIKSLRIRNVDWTLFPFSEQTRLRERLATFTKLRTLEFDDVMFHDLRELVCVTTLFPALNHLVANVQFSKYIEHTISSATALAFPSSLEVLRLGSDEGIPAALSTIFKRPSRLSSLLLHEVKFWHLQYITSALNSLGDSLHHLEISFSREGREWINRTDLTKLDLASQTKLHSLHLSGIVLTTQNAPSALETDVPSLISKIPSSKHMKTVTLSLNVHSGTALELFDWIELDRAVRRMERSSLHLNMDISNAITDIGRESDESFAKAVERFVSGKLSNLRRSKRLKITLKSN